MSAFSTEIWSATAEIVIAEISNAIAVAENARDTLRNAHVKVENTLEKTNNLVEALERKHETRASMFYLVLIRYSPHKFAGKSSIIRTVYVYESSGDKTCVNVDLGSCCEVIASICRELGTGQKVFLNPREDKLYVFDTKAGEISSFRNLFKAYIYRARMY